MGLSSSSQPADAAVRHPRFLRFARDDELFSSLLAGQSSVADPLMLVVSTVGDSEPLETVKRLADASTEGVFWRWSGVNRSPRVTAAFLARQRRILTPTQYAREHQNVWSDAANSFAVGADVAAFMSSGWTEQSRGRPGVRYHYFGDLGVYDNPTVIGCGHEEQGRVFIDRLVTPPGQP